MSEGRKQIHVAKFRKVVKALLRLGFTSRPSKGSHVFLKQPDGHTTTVPIHTAEVIDRGLARKIAADIDMAPKRLMYTVDEQ